MPKAARLGLFGAENREFRPSERCEARLQAAMPLVPAEARAGALRLRQQEMTPTVIRLHEKCSCLLQRAAVEAASSYTSLTKVYFLSRPVTREHVHGDLRKSEVMGLAGKLHGIDRCPESDARGNPQILQQLRGFIVGRGL